jgi:chemotaxis protein MotA
MDIATIVGLILAIALMCAAIIYGGSLLTFVDVPSVLIVV